MQNTHIHADSDALVAHIAAELAAISHRPGVQHIALSGGSTPKQLYRLLASEAWRGRVNWANLHLWWGDERCVPPQDPESNYGEAERLLLAYVPVPAAHIHRMRGEAEPTAERARYAADIATHIPDSRYDWIILGIGDDGHTASLFPARPTTQAGKTSSSPTTRRADKPA